jgi:putative component of toxin-antitoxin plasmid stabilization module
VETKKQYKGKRTMWSVNHENSLKGSFKAAQKKHPDEYDSVFNTFWRVLTHLNKGERIGEFEVPEFRSEGDGVYRFGQIRHKGQCALRLYCYPDEAEKTIHILLIGDKSSQRRDINEAKKIKKKILRNNASK